MSASTVIQDVAAVATAGGFVAAAVAIMQSKRVSRAQNFFALAQFLQDPEVRKARRRIFDAKDLETVPAQWLVPQPGEGQDAIVQAAGLVASSYDLTGRVVELGYVDHKPFLDDWGPSIKKAFETLEPFVKERRQQHKNHRYFDNFEELAASVTWWENSHISPWWLRRLTYFREKRRWARRHAAKAAGARLQPAASKGQGTKP